MGRSQAEAKAAVEAGYWHTYRYNPDLAEEGKNPFILDSKPPKAEYKDFIMGEVRYASLTKLFPETAKVLFDRAEKESRKSARTTRSWPTSKTGNPKTKGRGEYPRPFSCHLSHMRGQFSRRRHFTLSRNPRQNACMRDRDSPCPLKSRFGFLAARYSKEHRFALPFLSTHGALLSYSSLRSSFLSFATCLKSLTRLIRAYIAILIYIRYPCQQLLAAFIQKTAWIGGKRMEPYGTIRIKLDELIKAAGISKNKLSHRAEMQRSQINNYCNNKISRLDTDVLARLCTVLECEIGDLLEFIPPDKRTE